ncbi:aspartate kinase [Fulvivirgaceae bacterium PWU4]|uniref:Aspartokinase n=1 Tax=Chryseosolibacter histidini TaxID=2782349 RepID=A0AAP2GK24_9BACT|nr:aspartate kinase [Chryseosolibacter histidini]MBT1698916.1 aspartate kinase [Chryseosolibacter histidini]
MLVLKFGGTSVGKPERMKKIANLVMASPGKKIVVLSALSGTTNTLVSIGDHLTAGQAAKAEEEISALEKHYLTFIKELYESEAFQAIGQEIVSRYFILIRLLAAGQFDTKSYRELLAQGELISTELFYQHLQERKISSRLLPALHFMSIDENEEPELQKISARLKPLVNSLTNVEIIITQGYICRNHRNEIDNLKRGGSDYTASLIGAAIQAEEVQIWTDIDGMHNNDPRIVKKTVPISELTFDEASELAYFGAKILHPSTIVPAQKFNVPVRLKNTMDEKAPGTIITGKGTEGSFKAIAAKDGITAIKIKSSRMLMAYGFLRRVFEVFENHKTPIDMITTSEIAVSLTIDNNSHLASIENELKKFGSIEVDNDQTIICIVGNRIMDQKGVLTKVFQSLTEIPVRMVSCGGSANNVSVLIDKQYKEKALNVLNEGLFGLK